MDYTYDLNNPRGQQEFKNWVDRTIKNEINSYARQVLGVGNSSSNAAAYNSAAGLTLPINNQTGTVYTINDTDSNKLVTFNNGSAITVAAPNDSTAGSTNLGVGSQIHLLQLGTGQVTISNALATVNATPGRKLRTQYSSATLIKIAANSWILIGDLVL